MTEIFESCTKNLYSNYPITDDNYTQIIFGTAIEQVTYFYRINSHDCFSIKINDYYPIGSGGIFAKYVLKRLWNPELKRIDAGYILAHVIGETINIDQASSAPINIAEIFNSGYIKFLDKNYIDRMINAMSKVDKYFADFFRKFICDPKSFDIYKNGIIIKKIEPKQ